MDSAGTMTGRIAFAIAKADGKDFATDPDRYRRMATAALRGLSMPTGAMVDASHQAVWFDARPIGGMDPFIMHPHRPKVITEVAGHLRSWRPGGAHPYAAFPMRPRCVSPKPEKNFNP